MEHKRRILFVGEASFIATGFSTYWNEVIKRLYETGDFSIAELGSYASDGDVKIQSVPWKFYPVQPNPNDARAQQIFRSRPTNQFGELRFDDVCIDFKPDIVCGIRDWWMDEFVLRSPFRKYFKFIWMPTIDGEPQKEVWLDSYKQCDGILTYSEFGMNLLEKTGRPGTKLITIASPGADIEVFKPPTDKKAHKKRLGIDPNSIIIGTVMRNQKRKLYRDLIEAFAMWVHKAKSKGHTDLVRKTFLYLHTSYPDVGYDIGSAIKEFKVSNKVIMTYLCTKCSTAFPARFSGSTMSCVKCSQPTAHPPNANHQCPRHVLADIMKCFDLYVQYSVCVHPQTDIITRNGWKQIKDIMPGEQVVGSDGKFHSVYKTMKSCPGRCLDVNVKCRPWTITATDNHPFLRVKGHQGLEGIKNLKKIKFEYCRTDELQRNDLLVQAIPQGVVEQPDDLLLKINNNLDFVSKKFATYLDVAHYLGLFVADGHANKSNGSCRITLSNQDVGQGSNAEIIERVAKEVGRKARYRKYKDRAAIDIDINRTELMLQLREHFYNINNEKTIPNWILFASKTMQESFVAGLLSGDGHQKTDTLNVFVTTSEDVAKALNIILSRIGWYFHCHTEQKHGNRKLQYRFEIRTDGARNSHETLYLEKDSQRYVLLKITSVQESDYDDYVYNIDVCSDHNYTTLCGTTHNCEGWGMPLTEAMSCAVPCMAVNYSAMEDHLQCPTSIPIDVVRFFYEAIIETEQKRALPNNQDFVNKLDRFVKLSDAQREELNKKTRAYIVEPVDTYGSDVKMPRRSWDRTAAIWHKVLTECEIHDIAQTWGRDTAQIYKPDLRAPKKQLTNGEFIKWVIGSVWNRPDMVDTFFAAEWLIALNLGFRTENNQRLEINRQTILDSFLNLIENTNKLEQKRVYSLDKINPDKIGVIIV